MGLSLSREDILSAKDLDLTRVEVPEWGGYVFVRTLTGAERDAFEASVIDPRSRTPKMLMVNVRAKLASLTVCDDTGKRLFTEEDIEALGGKSASALQRVFDIATEINALTDKDVKSLEKN